MRISTEFSCIDLRIPTPHHLPHRLIEPNEEANKNYSKRLWAIHVNCDRIINGYMRQLAKTETTQYLENQNGL